MKEYNSQFIQNLKRQDADAFWIVYNDLVDQFYRYIKGHYSLDENTIQDLLSEVFVKIWQNVGKIDEQSSLSGFLRTIMRNHVKDYFKRNDDIPFATFSSYDDENGDTAWEDGLSNDQNVLWEVNRDYTFEQIQEAMSSLDESFKQIIHLKYIEEYSYEEIAYATGLSQDAVRQRISRGIKRLQEMLSHLK